MIVQMSMNNVDDDTHNDYDCNNGRGYEALLVLAANEKAIILHVHCSDDKNIADATVDILLDNNTSTVPITTVTIILVTMTMTVMTVIIMDGCKAFIVSTAGDKS